MGGYAIDPVLSNLPSGYGNSTQLGPSATSSGGDSGMGSLLVGGLAGLAGDLLGGNQNTTTNGTTAGTTTGSTNVATNGTSAASTNPILSALQKQLSTQAGNNAINANIQGTDLTGYTQQGLQNINSQNPDSAIQARLASSGQEFSPAGATAETQTQLNRINQGNQFLAGIPLLQTQLKQQALQGLNSTFSSLPTATQSAGATSGTTAGTTAGTTNTATNSNTKTASGILGALGF